jgi:hypothetical protein
VNGYIAVFAAGAWTIIAAYRIGLWHAEHKRRRPERLRRRR